MSETLGERDLRAWMAVIEDGRRDDPTEALPWAVLDGLIGLVRCDAESFPEVDLVDGHNVITQWLEDGDREMDLGDNPPDSPGYWKCVREFLPCSYAQRTGDMVSVVRWSDFYTLAQLRNTPLFAEYIGPEGTKHGLHGSFPTVPRHFRKISFWRDVGPDFTERDRLVVQLLRPHLYEVYLDAQRRGGVPRFSRREWEILRLADQGRGNADVARELFISVATVCKHLENIFDRTGARTRLAAAALMMPHFNAGVIQS